VPKGNQQKGIPNQTSSANPNVPISVEFEGKFYEAICSISNLDTYQKYRVMLYYSNLPPQNIGIYSQSNFHEMGKDAQRIFSEFLRTLPPDRLVPK
jgi:hypothetical protein